MSLDISGVISFPTLAVLTQEIAPASKMAATLTAIETPAAQVTIVNVNNSD